MDSTHKDTQTLQSILITGGAGYAGSVLTPRLLDAGYQVTVYDKMYFGCDQLPDHPALTVIEGDIRDTDRLAQAFAGIDAVIHLACISNDPSFELDEALSQTINYDCFGPMVAAAKKAGVERFIYGSTSSVYGVSDADDVTEDHPLKPLTAYNRLKAKCEPVLFEYMDDDFTCVVIRPATLCGYSPRMRFDLTVNILTNHAVNAGCITVFGGEQQRPNLHIGDMCRLYHELLVLPAEKIQGETFNVGYRNLKISEIAEIVSQVVIAEFPEKEEIEIITTPTDDIRSYHVNSDKIARVLGFTPELSVEDAVRDLCTAFRQGKFPNSLDDVRFFNVRQMKTLNAA